MEWRRLISSHYRGRLRRRDLREGLQRAGPEGASTFPAPETEAEVLNSRRATFSLLLAIASRLIATRSVACRKSSWHAMQRSSEALI